ncbi:MAG: HAD-IA family hydrolase [Thermoanaerobaculia bacterium]
MLPEIITFDCYGTLIDWERGIADAFASVGVSRDRDELLRAYHAQEAEVELDRWQPYRDVLSETARRVGKRLRVRVGDGEFLPRSVAIWPPFPDTNPALERIAGAGVRLAILSNVDDALLASTLEHFRVDFEFVVTAEQVRSYKPAHGHFLAARERVGGRRWLHAAQSWYHDIVPAKHLGIAAAWINRKGEEAIGEVRPDHEFRDLGGLARFIESKG